MITKIILPFKQNAVTFIILCAFANICHCMATKVNMNQAIDNVVKHYGVRIEPQLAHLFKKAHMQYPPKEIALLAFKREQFIQLWAKNQQNTWRYIHTYPLTAYSGRLGPKLREHDRQIPEGIYHFTLFNPLSAMHLSIMLNYPNHFDKLQASKDGRRKLGGNIFLHGKALSVGCLAVGDKAIEQLFILTRRVGLHNAQIIIAPNDLRKSKPSTNQFTQPRWLPELYTKIARALNKFPLTEVN